MKLQKSQLSYFYSSFFVTFLGLIGGAVTGYVYTGHWFGAGQALIICLILSILEISLSFDNAVVNASVLKDMDDVWRHRFITWGILLAVFGMRLVLPLVIVAIVAHLGPWDAIVLAFTDPRQYETIMQSVHIQISAFGGTFLLMVGLTYFMDTDKHVHWIESVEKPLAKLAQIDAFAIGLCVLILVLMAESLVAEKSFIFLMSGLYGLLTFVAVESVGHFLSGHGVKDASGQIKRSGLASFLYLEVLDASFSFDGVVGALAISNNLIIIMLGLGIGAMFVRSLTIMLVEEETLDQFRYLEHGAFYAVIALAVMMYLDVVMHIPEVITGLLGAAFIGISIYSSIQHRKNAPSMR